MIDWYYHDLAQGRVGPMTADDLCRRYRDRRIQRDTLVWRHGLREWQPLDCLSEELGLDRVVPVSSQPPPMPSPGMQRVAPGTYSPNAAPRKQGLSGCMIVLIVLAALAIPAIGILAAIAIPAYQDYTVRAKVGIALATASPLKEVIAQHRVANDACPDSDSPDLAPILQVVTENPYVDTARVGTLEGGACAFELSLSGTGSQADGRTVLFEAVDGGGMPGWDCRGGDLPAKYRPSQCRASTTPEE